MTPKEVKKYYRTLYGFNKQTGMSCSSLHNWLKWGYVPLVSQVKLEKMTNGALTAHWDKSNFTDR